MDRWPASRTLVPLSNVSKDSSHMEITELSVRAEKERKSHKPVRLRVCTAAGCVSSGAQAVVKGLDDAVQKTGLGERVQVCSVGCMRLCCEGPLVQADPAGALYERVKADDAGSIVPPLDAVPATPRPPHPH